MRDFLDLLDRRLAALSRTEAHATSTAAHQAGRTSRGRRRRPAFLGGVGAASAVVAAFLLTGTSAAELPILATPATDASEIRDKVPIAASAGVDFAAAHAFDTPAGPGYVLTSEQTDTVCLATPDPWVPGSLGAACTRPMAKVEREGIAIESVGDRAVHPNATNLVAFVLPDGAEDVQLQSAGEARPAATPHGVAVFEVGDHPATLTWSVDGQPHRRTFEGPLRAGGTWIVPCPDGRHVTGPAPPLKAVRGDDIAGQLAEQQAVRRAAQRKACAR